MTAENTPAFAGLTPAEQAVARPAAAREAGDPALLAHATAEQAYVLADLGQTRAALDLIQQAYSSFGRLGPARLQCWLTGAEAEIAAMRGDEHACRSALDDAASRLGDGGEDDGLAYVVLDQVHFARRRGNCLTCFGDAIAGQLAQVLAEMDGSFTRAAAGVHCDLARALFTQGERHDACAHLGGARRLALLTGSARQQRRIDQLAAHAS